MSLLVTVLYGAAFGGLVGGLGGLAQVLLERPEKNTPTDRRELVAWARAARAARSRRVGTLVIAAGLLVWPVGVVIGVLLKIFLSTSGFYVIFLATLFTSAALLRHGRRMRVNAAEQVLDTDPRPPIVYLRTFEFDQASSAAATRFFVPPKETKTYEERVARALRRVAPFVSIGNPTETLPELGSVRMYADDAEWQRKIEDLTRRGGMIILHVGDSVGLGWEVSHVVGLEQPERIILSTGGEGWRYAGFRRKFGHTFPHGLPQDCESRFLYFDADWTPRWLPYVSGRRKSQVLDALPGSPGEQRVMVLRQLQLGFARHSFGGADPGTVRTKKADIMPLTKAEKKIRNAWIAGLISGLITLIAVLVATTNTSGTLNFPGLTVSLLNLIDVLITFLFTFGIYRKSRVAAIGMCIYFLLGKLTTLGGAGLLSILVGIVFLYLYFEGARGTITYHRLRKAYTAADPSINLER